MPQCIFCNHKKVSKEHIWGKWWKKYYPPTEQDKLSKNTHQVTTFDKNGNLQTDKGQFSNSGASLSQTTKVVCKQCNNEWMSKIEADMEAAIIKVFINENKVIHPEQSDAFKKWMLLKMFLYERAYANFPVSSEELKKPLETEKQKRWKQFHQTQSIPQDFHFFIVNCMPPFQYGWHQYIPLRYTIVGKKEIYKIDLLDTCIFNVGIFIGVITNKVDLIAYLKGDNRFFYLNNLKNNFSNSNIHIKDVDETICSFIEKKYNIQLRRGIVPYPHSNNKF